MNLSEAMEKREGMLKLIKEIDQWCISQRFDKDSEMPKCADLNLAIELFICDMKKEFHRLNRQINEAVEGIEIENE